MAHIQPNGVVYLIRGYQGDKDYNHTYRFDTPIDQYNFFYNLVPTPKTKFSFTNQNYIRHTVGVLRLKGISDDYITCNYMMFKNTAFADKWFYAFIDKVEYVNNNCCEVYYTIDVIQTWWFDFEMGMCFVEREHTTSDDPFQYVLPEPLNTGVKVTYKFEEKKYTDFSYVMLFNLQNDSGKKVNGTFIAQNVEFFVDTEEGRKSLVSRIGEILTNGGTITSINVIPTALANVRDIGTHIETLQLTKPIFIDELNISKSYINGYLPRNNKLYTSQFCDLEVTDDCGSKNTYCWELMGGTSETEFFIDGVIVGDQSLTCRPLGYASGLDLQVFPTFDYSTGGTSFPQCSWSEDTYARYMASNKNSFNFKTVAGATSGVVGAIGKGLKGDVVGAIQGGLSAADAVGSSIAQVADLKNTPDNIVGNAGGNNMTFANGACGFTFKYRAIRKEELKMCDDYLTMFGYLINTIKIPNIKANLGRRSRWNYIKTKNVSIHPATVNGGLPSDDEKIISDIFNRGITFWEKDTPVGSYDLENEIPQG